MAQPQSVTVSVHTGTVTATSTLGAVHGQSGEWELTGASFNPTTAVADGSSNKYTITLQQSGTAISTALDSDAAGWALGTAYAFTMSSAGASLEFAAADVVQIVCTETGTQTMAGNLMLTFAQKRV